MSAHLTSPAGAAASAARGSSIEGGGPSRHQHQLPPLLKSREEGQNALEHAQDARARLTKALQEALYYGLAPQRLLECIYRVAR